jgi:hypothetical protein
MLMSYRDPHEHVPGSDGSEPLTVEANLSPQVALAALRRGGVAVIVKKRRTWAAQVAEGRVESQQTGKPTGRGHQPRVFVLGRTGSDGPQARESTSPGVHDIADANEPGEAGTRPVARRLRRRAVPARAPGQVIRLLFTAPQAATSAAQADTVGPEEAGRDWELLRQQLREAGDILRVAQMARRFRV